MNQLIQYWPQLIIISTSIIGLGIGAFKAGKHSIQTAPTTVELLIMFANMCLLFYGGFKFLSFANLLFLTLLCIGIGFKFKDAGKPEKNNFFTKLIATVLIHLLYYWGGFYDCFQQ